MLDVDQTLIAVDPRGRPRIAGIHDARLAALSVDFGDRLSFGMVGPSGERTNVVLDGVEMLHVTSLWEGVIVDSMTIWPVIAGSEDDTGGESGSAWVALLAGRVRPGDEVPEIVRAKHRHDGSHLVSLSSSFGGGLHALCRRVLINGRGVAGA